MICGNETLKADAIPKSLNGRSKPTSLLDLKISELLWLVCFNLLLFAPAIQDSTGFNLLDEMVTVGLCISALAKYATHKNLGAWPLLRCGTTALIALLAVITIGLLSNYIWGIQAQVAPILQDVFTCVKFPLALLSSLVVFRGLGRLFDVIELEAKVLIVLMMITGVANLVFDFGMGTDARYGLRASFRFIFPHPTYLVFGAVGLSLVFMRNVDANRRWIMAALVIIALSLRSKGIVYAALVIALLLTMGKTQKLTVFHVLGGIALAVLVGWDQFLAYYQPDGYARNELTRVSFQVASDFFPFGSGFATYGSAVTAEHYSLLYYQYGLSTVWGLAVGATTFLSDTFWPTVLGQFGWFGLAGYIVFLLGLFRFAYKGEGFLSHQSSQGQNRIAVICCFAYLLISSTSESAFFNPQAAYLAVCLGLVLGVSTDCTQRHNAELLKRGDSEGSLPH